jgi:hypothetical protein
VEEILASRTFAKAARLSSFLTYICQQTLEGKSERINEQQIGINVFSRSPSYQAADDSIVRSQARLLRQKLEEYFEHEHPNSPLIISIPKGGYVLYFSGTRWPMHERSQWRRPFHRLQLLRPSCLLRQ